MVTTHEPEPTQHFASIDWRDPAAWLCYAAAAVLSSVIVSGAMLAALALLKWLVGEWTEWWAFPLMATPFLAVPASVAVLVFVKRTRIEGHGRKALRAAAQDGFGVFLFMLAAGPSGILSMTIIYHAAGATTLREAMYLSITLSILTLLIFSQSINIYLRRRAAERRRPSRG